MVRQRRSIDRTGNSFCDETYRAIYRLEAGKPGAGPLLCKTLQAAWLAGRTMDYGQQYSEWLIRITPLCLGMLADYSPAGQIQNPDKSATASRSKTVKTKGNVMQVQVTQVEGVRFAIEARNHTIISDQPTENAGNDSGMTPPELLLASLGSCAAFYAVQYLKTRNLADSGVAVSVTAEKLKAPARLGNFRIDVSCPVPLTDEQQKAMTHSVHSCIVHNTLLSTPEIAIGLTCSGAEATA